MRELTNLRTLTSKTFDSGNGKRTIEASIGAIHYREDSQWKDIDPTIVNGKVAKAPYDLIIDFANKGFYVKSKIDGSELILKLKGKLNEVEPEVVGNKVIWRDLLPDTDVVIEAQRSRVKFKRILKSNKAPPDAEFDIVEKGKSHLSFRAIDGDGKPFLAIIEKTATKLTERIDLAGKKFPIEIDPTWQVGASNDDALRGLEAETFAQDSIADLAGAYSSASEGFGSGMRFTNITIPQGTTIDSAYLVFTCSYEATGEIVNTKISAEDVDNPGDFSGDDGASFDTRFAAHTTARVNWNAIPVWTLDTEYNSPEIKTVIQEIIDRGLWESGNAIVIFWEDFDFLTTFDTGSVFYRRAYSNDLNPAKAPKLVITYTPPVTTKTSSDTGQGADAGATLSSAYSRSETGAGSESLGSRLLGAIEEGGGAETLLARLLAGAETALGLDAGGLFFTSGDVGSGSDAFLALKALLTGADSGSGIDTTFLIKALLSTDSGLGTEAIAALLARVVTGELVVGSDCLVVKIESAPKGGGMKLPPGGKTSMPSRRVNL